MYENKIKVIHAIRDAFEKFKHHQDFTKRMRPYIERGLEKVFQDSLITYINVERAPLGYNRYEIKVWGGPITHNDPVYVSWSDMEDSVRIPWQQGLQRALKQADMTDYEERLVDERTLIPALTELENQVKGRIRTARNLIKHLPIPKSATVRRTPEAWDSPSSELQAKFPFLFSYELPKLDDE